MGVCKVVCLRLKPKTLLTIIVSGGLLLLPAIVNAQDDNLPCDGSDPYNPCPLDTWVWALAVIAIIFAVVHLYRKKKPAYSTINFIRHIETGL